MTTKQLLAVCRKHAMPANDQKEFVDLFQQCKRPSKNMRRRLDTVYDAAFREVATILSAPIHAQFQRELQAS